MGIELALPADVGGGLGEGLEGDGRLGELAGADGDGGANRGGFDGLVEGRRRVEEIGAGNRLLETDDAADVRVPAVARSARMRMLPVARRHNARRRRRA